MSMSQDFTDLLTPEERALYDEMKKMSNKLEAAPDKVPLISPLNDLIRFNPFQYEPYYKLTHSENSARAVYIADQVGAGKTIETGIILTELIYKKKIDLYTDRCIIVCPNLLCRKWRDTLKTMFGIGSSIVYAVEHIGIGLNILSYDTVSRAGDIPDDEIKMLIIDEAHNASLDRFNKLMPLRKKTTGYTVLLSATPLNGTGSDETNQLKLLFGDKDIGVTEDNSKFFQSARDNPYLCKNKKQDMRYATNSNGDCTVTTHITNHYVQNAMLNEFTKICEGVFKGKNSLFMLQGINQIISFPEHGREFIQKILDMTDDELNSYIESSQPMNDYDDESTDDFDPNDDDCDDGSEPPNPAEVKSQLEELLNKHAENDAKSTKNDAKSTEEDARLEDARLDALIKIIDDNNTRFLDTTNPEHGFFSHIIVFTDSVSTADYLEDYLEKKLTDKCKTFKVTGKLTESEKINRIRAYESVTEEMSILIITNVACEGQDMDYGNTIVNYDLNYNPVRLEQRRGRIDRFEVKKNNIYIHNIMIVGFDEDIEDPEGKPGHKFSKVKLLRRKINEIYKTTGEFYEILENNPNGIQEMKASEEVKAKIYSHVAELAGLDEKAEISSLQALHGEVKAAILKALGYEDGSIYAPVNAVLSSRGIKLLEDETNDQTLVIRVDKSQQAFLNNILTGGTLISTLIFGGK